MSKLFRTDGIFDTDLICKITDVLRRGEVALCATDSVYGLISLAFDEKAYIHLNNIKKNRILPYAAIFESLDHLISFYGNLNLFQMRIIRELLPGPVTLVLNSNENVPAGFGHEQFGLALRVPENGNITSICSAVQAPLWATSANRSGDAAPFSFEDAAPDLIDQTAIAVDSGSTMFSQASTVIDLRKLPYKVVREGPWMPKISELLAWVQSPLKILMVCTGNLCRSPLAASLLQHEMGEPGFSGVKVSSAGTSAAVGLPPTDQMAVHAKEFGIDNFENEAVQLTPEMLAGYDLILTAESYHRDLIVSMELGVEDRVELLGSSINIENIPDPYGLSDEIYSETAEIIRRAVVNWKPKISRIIESAGWEPEIVPQSGGRDDD